MNKNEYNSIFKNVGLQNCLDHNKVPKNPREKERDHEKSESGIEFFSSKRVLHFVPVRIANIVKDFCIHNVFVDMKTFWKLKSR